MSISQDSFYRELNAAEKIKASKGQFNFDHPGIPALNYQILFSYFYTYTFIYRVPTIYCKCYNVITYNTYKLLIFNYLSDAFDEVFMFQTLTDIQAGKTCTIPVYNYKTNSR